MLRELPEETCSRSLEARLSGFFLNSSAESSSFFSLSELAAEVVHQDLSWDLAASRNVRVTVRRDDLIHPLLSGNKLYKLHGHLQHWWQTDASAKLCSFGGAYSNHLHALAAFGSLIRKPTLGVVRGEKPAKLSKTLVELERMGMELVYVSRQEYRMKEVTKLQSFIESDTSQQEPCYWIPEGGAGIHGIEGCIALGKDLANRSFDVLVQACGTGTTLAGILHGLGQERRQGRRVIGISALRNNFELVQKVLQSMMQQPLYCKDWAINNQYHCGGFARATPELYAFIKDFEAETSLPIEKVYTAKVFFAVSQMIRFGQIKPGTHVLVMHSGGLQGRHGKI